MDILRLLLVVTLSILTAYIIRYWKRKNLPPGPTGIPIFGYYFPLRSRPIETVQELAKKYGNVVGFYVGSKYVVILNDWEALKDGLNKALYRPPALFEKVPYKFGFSGTNGEEWQETRRLTSKVMKDGLEKNQWEDLIQKELTDTIERLREEDGNPIELRSFFTGSFTNNVVSLILGERLEAGDRTLKLISRSVDFMMENLQTFRITNFSDALTKFLAVLGLEEIPPFFEETKEFFNFVSDTIDSNIHDSNSTESDTFISRFQEEIDIRKKTKQNSFATEDNLKGTLIALMIGGSETTRTSILWALIAMADHPDKQRKVHQELDRVIGTEGSVRWSERSKVPYTLATLFEAMRWKTTVPFPALRMTVEDIQIQGYDIPKGTYIATNIWGLHNDSKYWKDPDRFIPERFLLEDGQKVNMTAESFDAFSYGKRNCPGKLLALMDMLQYFSALMQKFKVLPKEGNRVKYEAALGLSYQARNAKLRFIPR